MIRLLEKLRERKVKKLWAKIHWKLQTLHTCFMKYGHIKECEERAKLGEGVESCWLCKWLSEEKSSKKKIKIMKDFIRYKKTVGDWK